MSLSCVWVRPAGEQVAGQRDEVFRPFFRLDEARNVDSGGTGLGLAVSRHWISRHRGKLIIDGRGPRGGARIRIKLPLRQEKTST